MPDFSPQRPGGSARSGSRLRRVAQWCESVVTDAHRSLFGERSGLVVFGFHAVAPAAELAALDAVVDPTLSASTEALAELVDRFLTYGYRFVSPDAALEGLEPGRPYAMLTFDDGYRNNLEILPVLRQYQVPAACFITTGHVEAQRAFWWDALYRERQRRGATAPALLDEQTHLKQFTHDQIEAQLVREFGAGILEPVNDWDRPMTISELQEFARDPLIHIGNHTTDHGVLTNYAGDALEAQIAGAQDALARWTGRRPTAIAYPNGNYSDDVRAAAARCGLRLGLTVAPLRNRLPLRDHRLLDLHRHLVLRTGLHPSVDIRYRSAIPLIQAAAVAGQLLLLARRMRP